MRDIEYSRRESIKQKNVKTTITIMRMTSEYCSNMERNTSRRNYIL